MKAVKAAVIHKRGALEIRTFPKPVLNDEELLVKVHMCGICGSDQHIFRGDWGEPYPIIPGHEFVGTVEELGKNAAQKHGVKLGDKVAVEMILPCGACRWCKEGFYNLCVKDREEGRQYGCNISCTRELIYSADGRRFCMCLPTPSFTGFPITFHGTEPF